MAALSTLERLHKHHCYKVEIVFGANIIHSFILIRHKGWV